MSRFRGTDGMWEIIPAIIGSIVGIISIYKFVIPKIQKKKNKTAHEATHEDSHLNKFIISLRSMHSELFLAKTSFGLDQEKIQRAEDFLNDSVYHLQSFKPTDEKNLEQLEIVRWYLERYTKPHRNGATYSEKKPLEECMEVLEHIGKSFGADLRPA